MIMILMMEKIEEELILIMEKRVNMNTYWLWNKTEPEDILIMERN